MALKYLQHLHFVVYEHMQANTAIVNTFSLISCLIHLRLSTFSATFHDT